MSIYICNLIVAYSYLFINIFPCFFNIDFKEWDYQKNKIAPNAVSRRSYKRAWWICKYGHSWSSKICERSIEKIPCKICENEFKNLLCQLLVMYYAGQYRFKVRIDSDEAVGLSVETYIPELNLIIEHPDTSSNRSAVKKSICSLNSIDYFEIAETEPVAMANRIKEVLRKRHIFIRSDSGEDIQICRERFFAWKESSETRGRFYVSRHRTTMPKSPHSMHENVLY